MPDLSLGRELSLDEIELIEATRPSRTTGLTGAAGEYYVAAELSRRGWLATVTIKNAPGTWSSPALVDIC